MTAARKALLAVTSVRDILFFSCPVRTLLPTPLRPRRRSDTNFPRKLGKFACKYVRASHDRTRSARSAPRPSVPGDALINVCPINRAGDEKEDNLSASFGQLVPVYLSCECFNTRDYLTVNSYAAGLMEIYKDWGRLNHAS